MKPKSSNMYNCLKVRGCRGINSTYKVTFLQYKLPQRLDYALGGLFIRKDFAGGGLVEGGLFEGSLLNLQVLGSAKHKVMAVNLQPNRMLY